MEYTTLTGTGMTVSRICLGCMGFGTSDWRDWVLDPEDSQAIIDRAIDLGINFFDTANMYSGGASERVLGEALAAYDRDWPVVATKGYFSMDDENPNASGLSRKAIEQELANSLERLGMETVDLYQIHRWDDETPIAETLRTLEGAVRRGRVRYVGASSMWAHQFAEALQTSDRADLTRFATMQNHYNLVYREEEREMLPLCAKEDVGVIPWSPLARGYLTRPHEDLERTARGEWGLNYLDTYLQGNGETINDRVAAIAAEKDVTMAQIALAWVLSKEWVDAPIVGVTSVEHLEDAVAALEIDLTESQIERLETPYKPVSVVGHD